MRLEDTERGSRGDSSLSEAQVAELVSRAREIETIFDTGPQVSLLGAVGRRFSWLLDEHCTGLAQIARLGPTP